MKAFVPRCFVLLLLLCIGLFHTGAVRAQIVCSSASMSGLTFSAVNPLSSQTAATATFTYTCTNANLLLTHSATVCFSIGEPNGGQTNPRLMHNGGNTLQFQLYQDPAHTIIWGSQTVGSNTPLMVNLTLGPLQTTTNTASLYGLVLTGQNTAIPGTYTDNYSVANTATTINDQAGSTAPGTCAGTSGLPYFAFSATAVVQKMCTVSADPVLNLGSVAAGGTAGTGSVNLYVTCSNTTPYYIGLIPLSTSSTTGAGTMSGAMSGNTNTVSYQLYQNASLSTVWGNTATTTSAGNGVSATGTGAQQSPVPVVYASITSSTDVQPDTYSDTVQINVNY
jgi:spore coat protein U-like protein